MKLQQNLAIRVQAHNEPLDQTPDNVESSAANNRLCQGFREDANLAAIVLSWPGPLALSQAFSSHVSRGRADLPVSAGHGGQQAAGVVLFGG